MLGKELISLAKRRGTKTINVVRRDEAANELKQLGCACYDCWMFARRHPATLSTVLQYGLCALWPVVY